MNKEGFVQILGPIILFFFAVMIISAMMPAVSDSVNSVTCKDEKATINSLNNQLNDCKDQLALERQKVQGALSGLGDCQQKLSACEQELSNCIDSYYQLDAECKDKEQPINVYYFVGLGITFTLKLFEINIEVEIRLLNKRNQRRLVRIIREHLASHPWTPTIIVLGIVLISNLIYHIF